MTILAAIAMAVASAIGSGFAGYQFGRRRRENFTEPPEQESQTASRMGRRRREN